MTYYYLQQDGGYAIRSVCLSFIHSVCLSVCLSVCVQDYCKSNQPISLQLDAIIGPTRKNSLTLGGDPVPDTDSRSLTIAE